MEAVIISGERKGEFINVVEGSAPSSAAEAMLETLVRDAQQMAAHARAAASEADALLQELRDTRRSAHTSEFTHSFVRQIN